MSIPVESIVANVEAKDAAGEYGKNDDVPVGTTAEETATPDGENAATGAESASLDTPAGTAAPPPAPKFNDLDFGGRSWNPEVFAKDPSKWDEFGNLMHRWSQSQSQKDQALAEQRKHLEGYAQQIEQSIANERAYFQQFRDPARGPLLLIQELESQLGYAIPEQLKQAIAMDPIRQLRLEQQRIREESQQEMARFREEKAYAERRSTVENNWKQAEQNDLIKATKGAVFDLWASYQLGDEPMDAETATQRTAAVVESLLDPEVFFALPERLRARIEAKWKTGYLGKKDQAARQTPLQPSGAPAATALGRQQKSRPLPSKVGGMEKYAEALADEYDRRP